MVRRWIWNAFGRFCSRNSRRNTGMAANLAAILHAPSLSPYICDSRDSIWSEVVTTLALSS
jgi:hypothetical protein